MAIQVSSVNNGLQYGFPVSKETAEKIYTGLGEKNWWKQLYDGKYHQFGPEVFDKGLHGPGAAEPGFYGSALKAFEFAKLHLKEKVSVEFYCNLHKEACAHFKGKENRTEMKAREAGRFRAVGDKDVRCKIKNHDMLAFFDRQHTRERVIRDYCILKDSYGDKIVEICADGTLKDKDIWTREFTITPADAQAIDTLIQNKIKATKGTLDEWAKEPIIKNAIPTFTLRDDGLCIDYMNPQFHGFVFDQVIAYLFESFNRTLSEMDTELVNIPPNEREKIDSLVEKKLVLIDDLYQKLCILHPFPDGQGRTTLLLLAKLLSENGFTPTILDEPYMSTYSSREDWVDYQKEGMQKWREEKKNNNL